MAEGQGLSDAAVAAVERIQPRWKVATKLDLLEHGRVRIFHDRLLPLIILFIETVQPLDDDAFPLLAITRQRVLDVQLRTNATAIADLGDAVPGQHGRVGQGNAALLVETDVRDEGVGDDLSDAGGPRD